MEKFRKFDDPRVGVNPFVPLLEQSRPKWLVIPRFVSLEVSPTNTLVTICGSLACETALRTYGPKCNVVRFVSKVFICTSSFDKNFRTDIRLLQLQDAYFFLLAYQSPGKISWQSS